MYELEKDLLDFEQLTSCKLVVHAVAPHFFFRDVKGSMELLIGKDHQDLRKVFPCCKAASGVNECIQHCVHDLRRKIRLTRPGIVFSRCKYGFFKIAVPVYRNNALAFILFAGIWKRPLEREKIRLLSSVLQLFAEGFAAKAQELQKINLPPFEREVILFIKSSFQQKLRVSHLAKHLSLSVSQTCHLIKRHFHQSFSELLTRERIQYARQLLTSEEDIRIEEVSYQCGYSHVEHFCRTFKKELKMTPGEYRKHFHLSGKEICR
jgi:AraC family transcriptional regulator